MDTAEKVGFLICIILLCIATGLLSYQTGYKAGQVDALIGKIQYKAENKTEWVKIK